MEGVGKINIKWPVRCVEYRGYISNYGYGHLSVNGKTYQTHRLTYQLFVGRIPKNRVIDHMCRNRKCCNPKHLRVVTSKENLLVGESMAARNSRKNNCHQGHPFNAPNTRVYRDKNGDQRICRKCHSLDEVRRRKEKSLCR